VNNDCRALFVAWQKAEGRTIFPVARLVRREDMAGRRYEFCYIKGCQRAKGEGFGPFLAFPNLERVYYSPELFPFFQNRVVPCTREDYPEYVRRLGLNPEATDELAVMARSGGTRATDRIELIQVPKHDATRGVYETHFLLRGVRHVLHAEERLRGVKPGERLLCALDCQNPHDPQAIALRTEDVVIVGYMPMYLLDDMHKLLKDSPGAVSVTVAQLNPLPAPAHHRLLCHLEAQWHGNSEPFSGEQFQPLVKESVPVTLATCAG
jgi:hypothetical protein